MRLEYRGEKDQDEIRFAFFFDTIEIVGRTQHGSGRSEVSLNKREAVELARSILLHFGAPLEEPKPEPKAGQMWQSEWGKMKCIVVRVESGISLLAHESGAWSDADKAILHANYKFVSESWAEEKTE